MASNKMQERIRSSAIGTAILSLIAFYIGDRIGTYIKIDLNMNLGNQFMQGIQSIMANPFFIDLETSAIVGRDTLLHRMAHLAAIRCLRRQLPYWRRIRLCTMGHPERGRVI